MSDKRQKISNAARKLDRAFELPAGTLSGGAHIELNSNREAIVDGCRGLINYSDTAIKLNVGDSTVTFNGRNLMIKTLGDKEAVLAGLITSVEFNC